MTQTSPLAPKHLNTLHTLKGIYPSNAVTQCLDSLTHNDVLVLIESGVNNLLIPDMSAQLKTLNVRVFALKDDIEAREIIHTDCHVIDHTEWVKLSVKSKRIINWF